MYDLDNNNPITKYLKHQFSASLDNKRSFMPCYSFWYFKEYLEMQGDITKEV